MEALFLKLLNLSITASYIVLAVILLRFLLIKAPKWINCLLWAVVGLRLAIPFSIESIFSLVPSPQPVPDNIMLSPHPQINTGIGAVNNTVNPIIEYSFTPDPLTSMNPLQFYFLLWSWIWLIGLCAMLIWAFVSYLRMRKLVAPSLQAREGVYLCDGIDTPFILGILRPRIYLPSAMSEADSVHVIAHEQAHLSRRDHLLKPLGFLVLAVYWFNPLFWLAYILFCRDVEKACDERVIKHMDGEGRRSYSSALLSCSTRKLGISACPLAFGEVGVKSRIRSILNYKRPAFWLIIVALLLCVALAVTFLTMPTADAPSYGSTDPNQMNERQRELFEQYPQYFGLDASNGLEVYVWQMAMGSYSFGLLEPHEDGPRYWLDTELLDLRGVRATDMNLILRTYDLPEDEIEVIPWQNPFSSYLPSYCIIVEGTDSAQRIEDYIKHVRGMLFLEEPYVAPVYDTYIFDVDGDGTKEYCILSYGRTSGIFTFRFTAQDASTYEMKYDSVFTSQWYDLSFKYCSDGEIRVQGITQSNPPKTHLFDISVDGKNIVLTENGVPVGEIMDVFIYDPEGESE